MAKRSKKYAMGILFVVVVATAVAFTVTNAPAQAANYAIHVVGYNIATSGNNYADPTLAEGPPDEIPGTPWKGLFVSLGGQEGYIVATMEEWFTDGPAVDIRVYEVGNVIIGAGDEPFDVYISDDAVSWIMVADNIRNDQGKAYASIDIAPNAEMYKYIKVVDRGEYYANTPGADIDAIEAIYLTLLPPSRPVAVAGTSLNGNNMLQLDGTLSSDPQGDPLTFSWQIEGEATPRTGQIVSIADLAVGNYQVTLTVSDSTYTDTDIMLFGVPAGAGVAPPPVDVLQEQVQNTKDKISSFSISSFDAPNDKAAENRRKALLNMLDKVSEHIDTGDYQAAIDQLRDILGKTDGLQPPDSEPDWIIGADAQVIFQDVSDLIADLLLACSECS